MLTQYFISLWTDYLKFFDQVIKEDGMEKVFNTFAFHPRMFPKLFTGAFHPLIHLGYGVEFQIPAVLAEGRVVVQYSIVITPHRFV